MAELASHSDKIPPETLEVLLRDLDYKTLEDLLYALGTGNQMSMVIAKRLVVDLEHHELTEESTLTPLAIKGTEGMVVEFAKCCQPIPGDHIVGCFQQGRGILVHASDCHVIKKSRNPEQFVSMRWDDQVAGEFWVDITVDVANQRGILAKLTTLISETDSNIGNVTVEPRDGRHNAVTFAISVTDRKHMARVMRRLRANKLVMRLYRKKQGE